MEGPEWVGGAIGGVRAAASPCCLAGGVSVLSPRALSRPARGGSQAPDARPPTLPDAVVRDNPHRHPRPQRPSSGCVGSTCSTCRPLSPGTPGLRASAWRPAPAPSSPALPGAAPPPRVGPKETPPRPRSARGGRVLRGRSASGSRRRSRFGRSGRVCQCPLLVPKEKPRQGRQPCDSPRSHVDVAGTRGTRGSAEM